ncbi:hypothetical protein T01_15226 [Trichinella spiralis]|uniref:Uncharacterized protein n=1 Tax=Trichinella spiralis TaxID=6334 RepID=A0A0V1ARY0_TRISP|nr:hypothetical protein T01_15226 [Trichinella spiralis]
MTPIDYVEAFNPEKSVMLDKFMSKAWSLTSNHMAFINDEEKRKNDDTPQRNCAMGKLHRFRGVLDMLYTMLTELTWRHSMLKRLLMLRPRAQAQQKLGQQLTMRLQSIQLNPLAAHGEQLTRPLVKG